MAEMRSSSYLWVTWLTSLLSGDDHCHWKAWFKAHYEYEKRPSDFDFTSWKAQHGEMTRERALQMEAAGYKIYVEGQNKFALQGKFALLGGTPDLVAVRGEEVVVVDFKTGQRRSSDRFQVLLYMLVLPYTHEACQGKTVAGEVQYKDGSVPVPPESLTNEIKQLIRATIERAGGDTPPSRVPSYGECRFCDITPADCPDRVDVKLQAKVMEHDLF